MSGNENRATEYKVYDGIITIKDKLTGSEMKPATMIGEEFVCWGYFLSNLKGKHVVVTIAVRE